MKTIKQIKQLFAEDLYSGASDLDFIPGVLNEMKQDYINKIGILNPEGEKENEMWEAGYVRGYEVALIELMNHFKSINICDEAMNKDSKTFTSIKLEDIINNLLTN